MYWVARLNDGPQRVNHAAVSVGSQIYSFGGYQNGESFEFNVKIDVHAFDTKTLRWRPVPYKGSREAPKKCFGHTVVAYKSKIYLWGGRNNYNASNTLYCFETKTFTWEAVSVTGDIPKRLDGHSACVIYSDMYVFGGYEEESETYTSSLYRLCLLTHVWEHITAKMPPPRSRDFHTASVFGTRMYIFGGRSGEVQDSNSVQNYSNEIMYLDTHFMKWFKPECKGIAPCGRRSHSAVVYDEELYIIGGLNGVLGYHLNDVHKFNPETSEWIQMQPRGEGPCPRRRHCACVVEDNLFLFGGSSPFNPEEYALNYPNSSDDSHFLYQLQDHSDMYILDFFPSLKRLCELKIINSKLKIDFLPKVLINEIVALGYTAYN